MGYYVNRYDAPIHVWDADDVEYIEPPKDEGDPFWDPIADALCGASLPGAETEPMETVAPDLREYVRRDPDKKCPGCILAVMERHNLPDDLRTDGLEERIDEWESAQAESDGLLDDAVSVSFEVDFGDPSVAPDPDETRTVPPGSTEADVVDAAREMMEDMERAGKDLSDLTLTVSPDVMDELRAHTFEVRRSVAEEVTLDGVPVLEDTEADGPGQMSAYDYETVSFDLEPMPTHPMCRSEPFLRPTSGGLPEDAEELLGMDVDELGEAVRAESGYSGQHPPKYVPEAEDPAPVHGKWPGISGVTYQGDTLCLDCAAARDLVTFEPEPAQDDVGLILRDTEWRTRPRCGGCERPLDVKVTAPETFTGTCVQAGDPVVLDDGGLTVVVSDTSVLGEDARLGQEYEVPAAACEDYPPR